MKTCSTCQKTYPDDFILCPRDGTRLSVPGMETEAQLAAGLSRRFRLIRRLGAGGMGTVFLAEQIAVGNRPVALKVLNRRYLDDPEFLLRFEAEAASTGRIRHANVVTLYDSGQADDGTPYIAMEFLEGESLGNVLRRRGAIPLPEVTEILQQTVRGLTAAHKLGIIHRDLKPDNIFLARGDEGELIVKVVDFGIAKLRESAAHSITGAVLGTPAYMSYEQASGMRSDELDARSDVYSLGVVVYEMLTGRVPFHSDTPAGYLRKHWMEEPPPFSAVAPGLGVPAEVESAVRKALLKDRGQRYPSALDFARTFAAAALRAPAAEFSQTIPSTEIILPLALGEPDEPMPRSVSTPAPPDITVKTPPHALPERILQAQRPPPQASKPGVAPIRAPAVSEAPRLQTAPGLSGGMKAVVIAVVALILIVAGIWYFSPPANRPNLPPPVPVGASQTGTGQQTPAVETPAPASPSPLKDEADAAERRKQVEAAIRQGNNYYENGDYNNAIRVYQGGLKVDPANAQLLYVLRRAQHAQATEANTN
jgi:eukaryotic-like serine/threonine-protein kinase